MFWETQNQAKYSRCNFMTALWRGIAHHLCCAWTPAHAAWYTVSFHHCQPTQFTHAKPTVTQDLHVLFQGVSPQPVRCRGLVCTRCRTLPLIFINFIFFQLLPLVCSANLPPPHPHSQFSVSNKQKLDQTKGNFLTYRTDGNNTWVPISFTFISRGLQSFFVLSCYSLTVPVVPTCMRATTTNSSQVR